MVGAFLSRRLRRWAVLAVGVPAAAWALDRVGERLEARHGETRLSRAIQTGGTMLHRHERGPAAHRGDRGPGAQRSDRGTDTAGRHGRGPVG